MRLAALRYSVANCRASLHRALLRSEHGKAEAQSDTRQEELSPIARYRPPLPLILRLGAGEFTKSIGYYFFIAFQVDQIRHFGSQDDAEPICRS